MRHMSTMTKEEVVQTPERVTERGITEVAPEELHKAIPAPRKMPAYQGDAKAPRTTPAYQSDAKAPLSRKPFVAGVVAGALGLALGAGAVFWASYAVTEHERTYSVILYQSGGGGSDGVTDGGAYTYPPTR